MRYIQHVTLTTGHARWSSRDEVDCGLMDTLQALLPEALATGEAGIEIPRTGGYRMTCGKTGRCLGVSVYGPQPIPTPSGPVPALLAYVGIAVHSRSGSKLWRAMHALPAPRPAQTSPDDCPPEPWCGVILQAGLGWYPEAGQWLGDFERCLAWAWLERK